VTRAVEESLVARREGASTAAHILQDAVSNFDVVETLRELEADMLEAANNLEFEKAALLRDQIRELKRTLEGGTPARSSRSASYGPATRRRGKAHSAGGRASGR
jgi:excinuclease ABC subunit B